MANDNDERNAADKPPFLSKVAKDEVVCASGR